MSRDSAGHDAAGGYGPDLTAPDVDLISSASDDPRAGDRLRTSVTRSSPVRWALRHRLILTGALVIVLGVAAGVVYVATRPPPVDPVVALHVIAFPTGETHEVDGQGQQRVSLSYQVTALVAGDVVTLVGVVGPGLSEPTSTIPPVHHGLPGLGNLGATIECADAGWWDATDADYHLRVVRTDAYGRATTYDAPLGDSSLGPSAHTWATGVGLTCFEAFMQSLQPAAASGVVAAGGHVTGSLEVRNTTAQPVRLGVADDDDGRLLVREGPVIVVAPGASGWLSFDASASDCSAQGPRLSTPTGADGQPSNDSAILVRRDVPRASDNDPAPMGWLVLDAASAATINSALATLCPGSPVSVQAGRRPSP